MKAKCGAGTNVVVVFVFVVNQLIIQKTKEIQRMTVPVKIIESHTSLPPCQGSRRLLLIQTI